MNKPNNKTMTNTTSTAAAVAFAPAPPAAQQTIDRLAAADGSFNRIPRPNAPSNNRAKARIPRPDDNAPLPVFGHASRIVGSGQIGAVTAADDRADINGDGSINFGDIALFIDAFNAGCIDLEE